MIFNSVRGVNARLLMMGRRTETEAVAISPVKDVKLNQQLGDDVFEIPN